MKRETLSDIIADDEGNYPSMTLEEIEESLSDNRFSKKFSLQVKIVKKIWWITIKSFVIKVKNYLCR